MSGIQRQMEGIQDIFHMEVCAVDLMVAVMVVVMVVVVVVVVVVRGKGRQM